MTFIWDGGLYMNIRVVYIYYSLSNTAQYINFFFFLNPLRLWTSLLEETI